MLSFFILFSVQHKNKTENKKYLKHVQLCQCLIQSNDISNTINLYDKKRKRYISKSRRVFVNKKAKTALKQYLQSDLSVIQRVYLFNTQKSKRFNTNALTQLVKRLYERVGIVGATSHSGRRTFITKLATSGVSVRVIAEAVGHSSIATTQRYIDVNDELISNAVELV